MLALGILVGRLNVSHCFVGYCRRLTDEWTLDFCTLIGWRPLSTLYRD